MRRFVSTFCAVLVLVLLGTALPTTAQIYRWTDAAGREHFTERLDKVPPEHRADALRGATRAAPAAVSREVPDDPPRVERRTPRRSRLARELVIPFERDGTLMRVDVRLNDRVTAPFFIDTGASGISVPSDVVQRLGIRVTRNTPTVTVLTAAGATARAVIRLDAVELAGARVEGLEATVNPAMRVGLLGGSFFNNFVYQVDAARSVITLRPNEALRGGLDAAGWRRRFREARDRIERLDLHLAQNPHMRPTRRARYDDHRSRLEQDLEGIEREADRLDVPHNWRR